VGNKTIGKLEEGGEYDERGGDGRSEAEEESLYPCDRKDGGLSNVWSHERARIFLVWPSFRGHKPFRLRVHA
jgi:hypothetical protein